MNILLRIPTRNAIEMLKFGDLKDCGAVVADMI